MKKYKKMATYVSRDHFSYCIFMRSRFVFPVFNNFVRVLHCAKCNGTFPIAAPFALHEA